MSGEKGMQFEDRTYVLTFLYKIIDDNQATIRYLDTKAGFGIAILGAMVGKILLDSDQLRAFASHGRLVLGLAGLLGSVVLVAAVLGFRTVFPTVNPARNVTFPDNLEPKFFIFKFGNCRWLRLLSSRKDFATLATTHEHYCAALQRATPSTIESILAAEVLKVSFIRQIKTDRLTAFAMSLVASVALFIVLVFAAPKPAKVGQRGIAKDVCGALAFDYRQEIFTPVLS